MVQATRYRLSERLQSMIDEVKKTASGCEKKEVQALGLNTLLYELDDMRFQAVEMEGQDVEAIDDYLEDTDVAAECYTRREKVAAVVEALLEARAEREDIALQLFLVLNDHIDTEIPDAIEERINLLVGLVE